MLPLIWFSCSVKIKLKFRIYHTQPNIEKKIFFCKTSPTWNKKILFLLYFMSVYDLLNRDVHCMKIFGHICLYMVHHHFVCWCMCICIYSCGHCRWTVRWHPQEYCSGPLRQNLSLAHHDWMWHFWCNHSTVCYCVQ